MEVILIFREKKSKTNIIEIKVKKKKVGEKLINRGGREWEKEFGVEKVGGGVQCTKPINVRWTV